MEWKRKNYHQTVRLEYQPILISNAEIEYPEKHEIILSFYEEMVKIWLSFEKREGETARQKYLSRDSSEERYFFKAERHRLTVRAIGKEADSVCFLAEFKTPAETRKVVRYWDLATDYLIPRSQILQQNKIKVPKQYRGRDFYLQDGKPIFV